MILREIKKKFFHFQRRELLKLISCKTKEALDFKNLYTVEEGIRLKYFYISMI